MGAAIVGLIACVSLVALMGGIAWAWRGDAVRAGKAETALQKQLADEVRGERDGLADKFQAAQTAALEERNRINHALAEAETEIAKLQEERREVEKRHPELAGGRLTTLGTHDPGGGVPVAGVRVLSPPRADDASSDHSEDPTMPLSKR